MKRIVLGCLGVVLLLGALVMGLACFWLFRELPMLDTALSLPAETTLESSVDMVVTVTNPHKKPVTLDSIDIADSFLSGFQVVGIEPKPKDTTHIPFLNQRSWDFGTAVQPGESLAVTFRLKSIARGHFSGDVDICNANQDFKTLLADVVVKEKLSNSRAGDISAAPSRWGAAREDRTGSLEVELQKETKTLRQAAVDYVVAEYGARTTDMKETTSARQKGLIVTVKKPQSDNKAMYWVMFEEVTPVFAGKPQPERQWKRLQVLGITGPAYGAWACLWSRELSDEEFHALSALESPKDILVQSTVVQTIIREKVLPEPAGEWHKGQFFVRATEAHAFAFSFKTTVSTGGNLMGITVYVDKDGTVITKSEDMLHVD